MKDPATLLNYFQALLKYSNFTHAARACMFLNRI